MLLSFRAVLRGLVKSRGFTTLVILSLALGVGVNSAMFTAVDSLLLRSLPVHRPQELMLYKRSWSGGEQVRFSYPAYRYFEEQSQTLAGLGGATILSRVRAEVGVGERIQNQPTVQMVTGGFFDVLGLTPHLGRLIAPEDDKTPGQHAVVVLSHAYWQRIFALDAGVIGRTMRLNELPFTIVGVAPRDFYGVEPGTAPDMWVPTMMQGVIMELPSLVNLQTFNWLYLIARPLSNVDRAQVVAEQAALQQHYNLQRAETMQSEQGRRNLLREQLQVLPGGGGITQLAEGYRRPMVMLMAAVGVVLLVSCLNLSMLVLARMTQRVKEVAVRLAIGAQPRQVMSYLGLESVMLTAVGAVLGTIVGQWLLWLAVDLMPTGPTRIPITLSADLHMRTLAFSAAIAVGVALAFALVPALRISRADLVTGLSNDIGRLVSRSGGGSGRIRDLIVVCQVAASIMLLMCGGLFIETLQNLRAQELGFNAERTLAVQVALPRAYQPAEVHRFSLRLLEQLQATDALGATWGSPSLLGGYESQMLVAVSDTAVTGEGQLESYGMSVAPNFFSTMNVAVLAGRTFAPHDTAGSPAVAILSETAARALFGGQSPLGQHLHVRTGETPYGQPIEIVGVVRDIRFKDLRSGVAPLVYRPVAQQTLGFADGLLLKASSDSAALVNLVQREMRNVDSDAVIADVETISQRMDRWAERERVLGAIAGTFGVLALLLACLGMFGVTSMVVSDRRREIAVRLAIGASLRQVTWLFVRRSLAVAALGCLVGAPTALLVARGLTAFFFEVKPFSSASLWIALAIAVSVPTIAAWLAVRSEGRIEPISALKWV